MTARQLWVVAWSWARAGAAQAHGATAGIVKKLKVQPEPRATSKSLSEGDEENVAALKKLEGGAFDKAYVDHEVAYHQQVLDAIHSTLLPNAKNPQLKALLEKVTPAFRSHLEHAKHLQGQLGSGTGTTRSG